MKKLYTTFGINRRNFFTWVAVAVSILAMASRIVSFICGSPSEGVGNNGTTWNTILNLLLPLLTSVWFIYALLRHGDERLHKTITPFYLGAVFAVIRVYSIYGDHTHWWIPVFCIVLSLTDCVIYRFTVNAGGIKNRVYALVITLISIASAVYANFVNFSFTEMNRQAILHIVDGSYVLLMLIAIMFVLIGMRAKSGEKPFSMRGDRNDGRRLRSLDPISGVATYIMPERVGAMNLFRDSFECTNAEKYIRQKREEGLESFGYTHLILAAYVRSVSQRPAINRFISGQKTYSRGEQIEVSMAIKKEMTTDGAETIINIDFTPNDTAEDVYYKLNKQVELVKDASQLDNSLDKVAGLLDFVPGLLMKFTVWFLKTLDYFGLLPRALTRVSPFHASMFITSMGSLGIPPIYHHLYNFGNIPIFLAFGIKRRQCEMQHDGSIVEHKYIDFSLSTDERICDGFYFASSFKYMKRCLNDPWRLDEPPKEVIQDVY